MAAGAVKQAAHSPGSNSTDTLVVFSLHDALLSAQIREVTYQIAIVV